MLKVIIMKKTLVMLGLASVLAGCGLSPAEQQKQQTKAFETLSVVPTAHAYRSDAGHYTSGSYTFPFISASGVDSCAFRDGTDVPLSIDRTNNRLQYETMRVDQAADARKTVVFRSEERTPEGCYVIASWDDLGDKR